MSLIPGLNMMQMDGEYGKQMKIIHHSIKSSQVWTKSFDQSVTWNSNLNKCWSWTQGMSKSIVKGRFRSYGWISQYSWQ